jgi:hypothetical protein
VRPEGSTPLVWNYEILILSRSELQNLPFKLHFTPKWKNSFQLKAAGYKKMKIVM